MWTVSQMICMGMLLILAILDFYKRKVPVSLLILGSMAAVGYQLAVSQEKLWIVAGGIGIGLVFFALSRFTGEGIGYGDSWGILNLGVYLGVWNLLGVLASAFVLLLLVVIPVLCVKKMSRRCMLPFYPFLAGGYLTLLLAGSV